MATCPRYFTLPLKVNITSSDEYRPGTLFEPPSCSVSRVLHASTRDWIKVKHRVVGAGPDQGSPRRGAVATEGDAVAIRKAVTAQQFVDRDTAAVAINSLIFPGGEALGEFIPTH